MADSGLASSRVSRRPTPRAPKRARRTVHYYLAMAGYASAVMVCVLNLWAYYNEGLFLTQLAFVTVAVTIFFLFMTWFWGMFLLMTGVIQKRRQWYLLFHAILGSISPMLFTIGVGFQMDTLTSRPVGALEVELELAAWLVLTIQLVSGWVMLQRGPWRTLREVRTETRAESPPG